VDGLIEQVTDQLKQQGLYDKTLILITSDHGEEFNDNGLNFWGHGSNYTKYQVQVPLLIHWPGRDSQAYPQRTSHMDLSPTLLTEVLGCSNDPKEYSIGRSLFDRSPRPWIYAGSYYNYGILMPDSILETYPTGNFELLDNQNRPLPENKLDTATSLAVLESLSRFYR
jgi:hypothetical protein